MDTSKLNIGKARPLILIVLDGWGLQRKKLGNAIAQAKLKEINRIWNEYPHTVLKASDGAVGLPEGVMGNSEVGHLNLGAGRVIPQDLVRINKAIKDSDFMHNSILNKYLQEAKKAGQNIHFMGLLSDSGVHSDINHLFALLTLAKTLGCSENVWIHCFLDGRDTAPKIAEKYIIALEKNRRFVCWKNCQRNGALLFYG